MQSNREAQSTARTHESGPVYFVHLYTRTPDSAQILQMSPTESEMFPVTCVAAIRVPVSSPIGPAKPAAIRDHEDSID